MSEYEHALRSDKRFAAARATHSGRADPFEVSAPARSSWRLVAAGALLVIIAIGWLV